MRKREKGFSLLELLIVVAIILIIAAIAIPKLSSSKMLANETSAIYSLKAMLTAATEYSSTYGNGYPATLGALGGPSGSVTATCDAAQLVDSVLSNNGVGNTSTKSGFQFTYTPGTPIATPPPGCTNAGVNSFSIVAVPVQLGSTGQRSFYIDISGTIHFTTDGSAPTASSPALQ
jgi:type IV pilus assembly protein PilA